MTTAATNWAAAALLALLLASAYHLDGPSEWDAQRDQAANLEAAEQDAAAAAIASREFAARQVCGNGDYIWADDKTLVCQLRKPLQLARAKL